MHYQDISTDTETLYRLNENEQGVFFMFNRTGKVIIELAGPRAAAHVFAFYTGARESKQSLVLPNTGGYRRSSCVIQESAHRWSRRDFRSPCFATRSAGPSCLQPGATAISRSSEMGSEVLKAATPWKAARVAASRRGSMTTIGCSCEAFQCRWDGGPGRSFDFLAWSWINPMLIRVPAASRY